MEKPKFKGHLKLLILKLLEENPLHGYGIMSELEKTFGIKVSPGAIYPILSSLRKSGLIEVAREGKREKKLYRITEKGEEYLKKHEDEVEEALEIANKLKEFSELGGREVAQVLREVIENIDKLSEEQKTALAREFSEFVKRIKIILLGGE
ncbi:PadR family transcriptional regulator [Pyrococcus horikoshii]|nr:PadR family transcriptional regulator [Pyrococcus horikoshii]HII61234.1 PadR family transcriptional regulator [Pyrococcus horikoshii]